MPRAAVLLLAGFLAGCAPRVVVYRSPDFATKAPERIAVLPFDNESLNLQGARILRKLVNERVAGHGYLNLPVELMDARLKEIGITDGGQLGAYSAQDLGRVLGVDGLLYGVVEQFTHQNVGFAQRRAVRLKLKLVLAATDEKLFEAVGAGVRGKLTLDKKEARRAFVHGLVRQAAEGMLKVPLMPESRLAVDRIFRDFPRR